MSEVVPLPSFGEVFFDERGQERVLRVTWHDGTLVLSLWRGEMCTASFRMPLDDVARLVDTLDEGFVEAGGRYPDEVDEEGGGAAPAPAPAPAGHAEYPDPASLPGTGQYARPRPEDYAQPAQPQHYTDPAATQVSAPVEEPRPAAALGPNDVLVARGSVPPADAAPGRSPGYGPADVVPPENMIVGDSLPSAGPASWPQPGEQPYQVPEEPYGGRQAGQSDLFTPAGPPGADPFAPAAHRQPDAYGQPDPYAQPDAYAQADPYAQTQQADLFTPAASQPDPYEGRQAGQSDLFTPAGPPGADPFAPAAHRQPDAYGQPDPYAQPDAYAQADPYAQTQQGDRFGPPHSDGFPAQAQSTDPYGIPPVDRDPYGYPPPAQPDPYAFGDRQAPAPGHAADPYGMPPAYDQQGVDPHDPLNLRGQQHPEQRMSRPYVQDQPHSTGERLRPEQGYDERGERREW
ncbi:hypothetical protein ACFOWE_01810 [Planomonospora corallina]|uniref:Uncharacterized protein n=1 Tax=Planomonospora corallina TaxID=1806052 RepID=A0ABV8I1C5_9ACTN